MLVLDIEPLDIERLHRLIGGYCNSTQDFIVVKNFDWNSRRLGRGPLRAEANGMTMCTRGEMKLTVDLREHTMRRGCMMIYGPAHIIEVQECSEDFLLDMIVFTSNFSNPALLDMNAIMPIYHYLDETSYDMLELGEEDAELSEDFFTFIHRVVQKEYTDVTYYMVSAFLRIMSEIYGTTRKNRNISKTRQAQYFEHFLELVNDHHREDRNIKFYADQLSITPKHLSMVIKEYSGKSASDWINDFIAQEAKIMLRFTKKSIQEIAYELHFTSQSFFGKFFKRITGMTPSEYRSY